MEEYLLIVDYGIGDIPISIYVLTNSELEAIVDDTLPQYIENRKIIERCPPEQLGELNRKMLDFKSDRGWE